MKKDYSKLWVLFKSMFVLSACTFGGGFVIVSLMKKKFVEELQWLEEDEMLDVTAITQSAPGPLPVNASGDHRISDRRGNRFTDGYSWYNSSADDHYFHHLTVL